MFETIGTDLHSTAHVRVVSGMFLISALVGISLVSGCGQSEPETAPVTGEVVFKDGSSTPSGGKVIFVSAAGDDSHSAKGFFGADGKFQLSKFGENDGVIPGEYQVAVLPTVPDDRGSMSEREYLQALQPIDSKYLNPLTSGLRYTVSVGSEPQHFRIEVTKPGRRR